MRKESLVVILIGLSLVGCSANNQKDITPIASRAIIEIDDSSREEVVTNFKKSLEEDNQQGVLESYLEIKYFNLPELGEATQDVEKYYNSKMNRAYEAFNNGEVSELESVVKDIEKMGISTTIPASDGAKLIQSKEDFKSAVELENNEEFEKAYELFSGVVFEDYNYTEAQQKSKVCLDKYLEQVSKDIEQLMRDYKVKEGLGVAESVNNKYNNEVTQKILEINQSRANSFTNGAVDYCLKELYKSSVNFEEIVKIANAYNELIPDTDAYLHITTAVDSIVNTSKQHRNDMLDTVIGCINYNEFFDTVDKLEVGSESILNIEDCYNMSTEIMDSLSSYKYMIDNGDIVRYDNIDYLKEVIDIVTSAYDTSIEIYGNIGYMYNTQKVDEVHLNEIKNDIENMKEHIKKAEDIKNKMV